MGEQNGALSAPVPGSRSMFSDKMICFFVYVILFGDKGN